MPELLEEMTAAWIIPNVISYNAPPSACEKGQQGLKRILQLLEEMTAAGMAQNVIKLISYNAPPSACDEKGQQ